MKTRSLITLLALSVTATITGFAASAGNRVTVTPHKVWNIPHFGAGGLVGGPATNASRGYDWCGDVDGPYGGIWLTNCGTAYQVDGGGYYMMFTFKAPPGGGGTWAVGCEDGGDFYVGCFADSTEVTVASEATVDIRVNFTPDAFYSDTVSGIGLYLYGSPNLKLWQCGHGYGWTTGHPDSDYCWPTERD